MQMLNAVKRWSGETPTIHPLTGRYLLGLAFILVMAGVVRFAQPDAITWSKDHSDMAMMAQDIVDGKGIPLVGQPSSAVIPHSPFYIYVLVFPYLVTDNPVIVTMFIALLDMAAVALLWFIGLRYFGPVTGFVAALAYAVHPWAVAYSRTIWAGDHRVLLFLIALSLGLYGFLEGRRWAQVLCLPIMIIALQVHFAAWALLPVYILLVWAGRSRTSARVMVVSGMLGLLAILPFGIGIVQTLSANTALASDFQGQVRNLSLRDIVKPAGQAVWLMTGLGSEQYSAREIADELIAYTGVPVVLWVLQGVALFIGVITIWRRTAWPIAAIVVTWAFLPPIVFLIPLLDVYPHYFMSSIPAYCLLAGVGVAAAVDWAGARKRYARPAQAVIVGAVGVIVLTQMVFVLRERDYLDRTYAQSQFGTGPSLRLVTPVIDSLKSYNDVLVIVQDDWLDWSKYGSWVYAPFLRDTAVCLREFQASDQMAVRPQQPFAVLYAPRLPQTPLFDSLYQADDPVVFDLRPGEGAFHLYSLDAAAAWPDDEMQPLTPHRFASGVDLQRYALRPDQVVLEWTLPGAQTGEYAYTITFKNALDETLAQETFPFWDGRYWCAGDTLMTWADAAVPEGTAALIVTLHPASIQDAGDADDAAIIPIMAAP